MREFDAHEQVVFGHDAASGMRAIIAIHSTILGPAAGGCRVWPYASTAEAVADVLRLSRGMSYKSAIADLRIGGGKAVILGDPAGQVARASRLRRFVDSLGGRCVTADTWSTAPADIAGGRAPPPARTRPRSETGGDPGPKTALGVYLGTAAVVPLGRGDLPAQRGRGSAE